jgi:hypothetical protein
MAVTATRHGKHLRKTDWKDPPFFMGKLTISKAMFNVLLLFVCLPEDIEY